MNRPRRDDCAAAKLQLKLTARVAVVLLTVAACKGPPARLIAGIADTVVVNNVHAVQMPMHVSTRLDMSCPIRASVSNGCRARPSRYPTRAF